jgi:hypothetical protein
MGQSFFAKGGQPHVWQWHFYDFNVWSERKRVEKLRYMHRNPVKEAGGPPLTREQTRVAHPLRSLQRVGIPKSEPLRF